MRYIDAWLPSHRGVTAIKTNPLNLGLRRLGFYFDYSEIAAGKKLVSGATR